MSQIILVVDDDEVLGQVLQRVLTRDGYQVIQAGSVAEALGLAHDIHPQLALLDVGLPDGDGRRLGRDLLAMLPDLDLVLMTALPVDASDLSQARGRLVELLKKPVDLVDLRRTIAATLAAGTDGVPSGVVTKQAWCVPEDEEKKFGAPEHLGESGRRWGVSARETLSSRALSPKRSG